VLSLQAAVAAPHLHDLAHVGAARPRVARALQPRDSRTQAQRHAKARQLLARGLHQPWSGALHARVQSAQVEVD